MKNSPQSFTVAFDDPFALAERRVGEVVERSGCSVESCCVTMDRGEDIVDRAEVLSAGEIEEAISFLIEDGLLAPGWAAGFLDREFVIDGMPDVLRFTVDSLHRAAVKFGWALGGCEKATAAGAVFAFHRTEKSATALEHLFLGLELRRRSPQPAAIALRLPGSWEPAMDFEGDALEVERALAGHVAIARSCGTYRLSIREAAGKFSLLPVLARIGGDCLHLDLTGACWLEAMRTLARVEPLLFREVLTCAQEHFPIDASGRCRFTTEEDVRSLPLCDDAALEALFLDDPRGRQLLHVTQGSILGDAALRERLTAALAGHADLYSRLAAECVERHLFPLHAAPQ
jgi:tagaturonate epimerase